LYRLVEVAAIQRESEGFLKLPSGTIYVEKCTVAEAEFFYRRDQEAVGTMLFEFLDAGPKEPPSRPTQEDR
jgi:hypothetical protein